MPEVTRSARSALPRYASTYVVASLVFASSVACAPKGSAPAAAPVDPAAPQPEAALVDALPPATAAGEGGFALVWYDALLHRSPDDGAPLQAYDFGDVPRERRPGQVFTVTRLESRGEWVKVGGVDGWLDDQWRPIHCIGSDIFDMQGVDVAVWVHERDLAPVLTAPFELRHADGTYVSLTPGVPLIGGRPWLNGYSFPFSVPAESIGLAYEPTPVEEASLTPNTSYQAKPASIRVSLGGDSVPWSQPVWSYAEEPIVRLTEEIDGKRHLVEERCGSFELAVEGAGHFTPLPVGGVLGGMVSAGEPRPGGLVAAGTPLLWPDGTPAGLTVAELRRPELAPGSEPMTCIEVGVGRKLKTERFRGEMAQICVETSRIEAIEL